MGYLSSGLGSTFDNLEKLGRWNRTSGVSSHFRVLFLIWDFRDNGLSLEISSQRREFWGRGGFCGELVLDGDGSWREERLTHDRGKRFD